MASNLICPCGARIHLNLGSVTPTHARYLLTEADVEDLYNGEVNDLLKHDELSKKIVRASVAYECQQCKRLIIKDNSVRRYIVYTLEENPPEPVEE